MADESDATGSANAPNYTPNENDVNLGTSERDRQHLPRSRLGSDLETGKPLGPRDQFAQIRNAASVHAMDSGARLRSHFKRAIKKVTFRHEEDEPSPKREGMKWRNKADVDMSSLRGRLKIEVSNNSHDEETGKGKGTQYTLTAQPPRGGIVTRMLGMFGFSLSGDVIYEDESGGDNGWRCCGVSLNLIVTKYLHWTFRSSFFTVIFSAALGFFILTLIFAALILWAGRNHPVCIHVGGEPFGNSTNRFGDAYALSWTTFSTVGYGVVFPSTGIVVDQGTRCVGIQILCSLEAFVGLLFASFCGAILVGKVSRVRRHAQVIFSDPLVLRYGTGVKEEVDDESTSCGTDDGNKQAMRQLPCPVLEFRVVNRLHSTNGGELIDASLRVVARIDENEACQSIRNAAKCKNRRHTAKIPVRRRQSSRVRRRQFSHPIILEHDPFHSGLSSEESMGFWDKDGSLREPRAIRRTVMSFEEDASGIMARRQFFAKLELDTPDHPFFKRTWTARHTLDADSPLLSDEARKRIRENRGLWPEELNSHEAVRNNVHFDHIIVSLTGTCNADSNYVHAQKVYDYVDMNVGYRFANVLYRNMGDGSLRVDTTVINDVLEQVGGGGEPLIVRGEKARRFSQMLFI